MALPRREFLLGTLGAVLGGCAGAPTVQAPAAAVAGCCASLSDARLPDYKLGTLAVADIGESSPTLDFPTGRSRFAGYRVAGAITAEMVLETVTEYEGIIMPAATIFVPRFAFFDASFKDLGSAEPELYQSTGRLYESGIVRRAFYGACFVPPATAYIVVYTDALMLGKRSIRLLNPGGMGASIYLDRAREAYRRMDKRDFARGQVKQLPSSNAFATFQLPRKATGEARFAIS